MTYVSHTETHAGLTIEIVHDEMAQNPFEDMDCLPPIIASYDKTAAMYGDMNTEPLGFLDAATATAKFFDICAVLDLCPKDTAQEVSDYAEENGRRLPAPSDFLDVLTEEYLNTMPNQIIRKDDLDILAALYKLAGIPAAVFTKNGYCKGDTVYVLVVHLPKWKESVGAPDYDLTSDDPEKNGMRDMEGTADLYAAWAFGDCWGFQITDPDDEDADLGDESSGWGFYARYGSDDWDHLMAEARAAAESIAKERTPLPAAA